MHRKLDDFVPLLIQTIDFPEVEIAAVYPQTERAIRAYIYRKVRMAGWVELAKLLNSDTE